jgi:hypothetical protein
MENSKVDIRDEIIKVRPKLSENSLKTYVSLISTLCSKLEIIYSDLKKHVNKILDYIETLKSLQSKKTMLSACYIISSEEKFKTKMLEYCSDTNDVYKEQKLSKSREDIDFKFEDVKLIYSQVASNLKKSPSIDNYVNFIIISLMSGVTEGIAPRRLEYADVKQKNYDSSTDNYIDVKKGIIVLNKYKTVLKYGQVIISIPKPLIALIKKFQKVNTSDYLLVHGNSLKNFNASELSKRVQLIFGKGIGVDMLRSVFLSNFYKDLPEIKKMDDLSKQMGHSINSAINFYVKK